MFIFFLNEEAVHASSPLGPTSHHKQPLRWNGVITLPYMGVGSQKHLSLFHNSSTDRWTSKHSAQPASISTLPVIGSLQLDDILPVMWRRKRETKSSVV